MSDSMTLPETTTHFEWRVAYISDGSVEEMLDPADEFEARAWLALCNKGSVEGVEPGDAFLQKREVVTTKRPWTSVLD